jgi:hypothetical protein
MTVFFGVVQIHILYNTVSRLFTDKFACHHWSLEVTNDQIDMKKVLGEFQQYPILQTNKKNFDKKKTILTKKNKNDKKLMKLKFFNFILKLTS